MFNNIYTYIVRNWNLTHSKEKEATAKQAFTFPSASLTEPQVAQRATADTKRLGSGSVSFSRSQYLIQDLSQLFLGNSNTF